MTGAAIPVLLYHSVNDGARAGAYWGAVSRAEFARHVDVIWRSGRHPITITALAEGLRAERALPQRPVAITFDDGYLDTYDAISLLGRRGLAATVYVTTANIGALDRLSAAQVADLAHTTGVEIGAHGVHHRRLDELDDRELAEEIVRSKAHLERLTGKRADSFAYPHGSHDHRARAAVIAAGYRSAAAVKNALSHRKDDPFAIARLTVNAGTSAERIARILEGKDAPLARDRERLRTRAYRTARRQRRRLLGERNRSW
jgi:peptidoglycan/xylan/chitin deacetylase (PgdA/CDA1 family)